MNTTIPEFNPVLTPEDGLLRYTDGRVSGIIDLSDDQGVIYEWNSSFPGHCHTIKALEWLREGGRRKLTAYNMGLPPSLDSFPERHVSYWLKMKDLGLVHTLIDDNDCVFDESFRAWDDYKGVPDEVDERYAYGKCMYLAAALNRTLGWPIRVATSDSPDAYIEHAWVAHDQSGMMFDIGGCYLETRNGWISPSTVLLSNFNEDDLLKLTRRTSGHALPKAEWDIEVEKAIVVLKAYLRPHVAFAQSLGMPQPPSSPEAGLRGVDRDPSL